MVKKNLILRVELDFVNEAELGEALEDFATLMKNWDNKYQGKQKRNKIKYFVHEE